MSQNTWSAVDDYFSESLVRSEQSLDWALQKSEAAGSPHIQVTPAQGKLLHLLIQISGARHVLEIGTLGGYSSIWMASALPKDGHLVTLEASLAHARVARANIEQAGLAQMVEVRIGNALETLPQLFNEKAGPFDFIFIDADKPNNPAYLDWALKLSEPGTVIVCDNVVRDGKVIEANSTESDIQGVRRYIEMCSQNPRLSSTAIQTVGAKGYDGFSISIVQS
jgi:predicted O-methyltransferase YrrM